MTAVKRQVLIDVGWFLVGFKIDLIVYVTVNYSSKKLTCVGEELNSDACPIIML
jgi:hypothetical protein